MTNKLIAHLGCPSCQTKLFRLEAKPASRPGVFEHETVAVEGVDTPGDGKTCPVCGAALVRVA